MICRSQRLCCSCIRLLREAQQQIREEEIRSLEMYQEKGIYRCKGRIMISRLPAESVHPIFLPKTSVLTRLIILDTHERLAHAGTAHTLTTIRKRFWIPQGRATVQHVIQRHCVICKRWNAKPFKLPTFPDLPAERTTPTNPFTNVGLDYFGPIRVRIATNK